MPRKEFESFTRLDASDVNTYLMDQSVMTFGGTAARGSAIPTPVQGMYAHLNDTDTLTYYNGSAWESVLGGAWTAFTPTWISGLTVGNGVYNNAHFNLVGKQVTVAIDFSLGSTSAVTGDLQFEVPIAIQRKNAFSTGSYTVLFGDTGVGNAIGLAIAPTISAQRFALRPLITKSGTNPVIVFGTGNISSSEPFTWGDTDRIVFGGTYEVA